MNYIINPDLLPEIPPQEENASFSDCIETIYYTLTDAISQNIVRETTVTIAASGDVQTYPITFEGIPEGEYILTVWGNLPSGNNSPRGELHRNSTESTDIYVSTRKLQFDSSYQTTKVPLERTKGKLLLLSYNFPTVIGGIKLNIDQIYQSADEELRYTGIASVEKFSPFQSSVPTLLAPSPEGSTSILKLDYYTNDTGNGEPFLDVPPIYFTMYRNEISAVKVDYNIAQEAYEVYIYIQNEWTLIHQMTIEEIEE
ncbi:hypothetical protein [Bacteroides sp. UBA939]|uniref:hypothetical protein n=1 Tax=Bacteroides sp. UBA939 TaxID=1946092 RepID=UPI0025C200BD|nr:hypothetical protein [Bacteroides sp. UBA939]